MIKFKKKSLILAASVLLLTSGGVAATVSAVTVNRRTFDTNHIYETPPAASNPSTAPADVDLGLSVTTTIPTAIEAVPGRGVLDQVATGIRTLNDILSYFENNEELKSASKALGTIVIRSLKGIQVRREHVRALLPKKLVRELGENTTNLLTSLVTKHVIGDVVASILPVQTLSVENVTAVIKALINKEDPFAEFKARVKELSSLWIFSQIGLITSLAKPSTSETVVAKKGDSSGVSGVIDAVFDIGLTVLADALGIQNVSDYTLEYGKEALDLAVAATDNDERYALSEVHQTLNFMGTKNRPVSIPSTIHAQLKKIQADGSHGLARMTLMNMATYRIHGQFGMSIQQKSILLKEYRSLLLSEELLQAYDKMDQDYLSMINANAGIDSPYTDFREYIRGMVEEDSLLDAGKKTLQNIFKECATPFETFVQGLLLPSNNITLNKGIFKLVAALMTNDVMMVMNEALPQLLSGLTREQKMAIFTAVFANKPDPTDAELDSELIVLAMQSLIGIMTNFDAREIHPDTHSVTDNTTFICSPDHRSFTMFTYIAAGLLPLLGLAGDSMGPTVTDILAIADFVFPKGLKDTKIRITSVYKNLTDFSEGMTGKTSPSFVLDELALAIHTALTNTAN